MTSQVRQGVILAAGRGTRLQPFSSAVPKPLLPICNKPIMQYQLEAMREAGIREVAVVVGPNGAAIRDYFATGPDLGLHLAFVDDPDPSGIAGSLARVQSWVRGPFAVFLGDIFLALTSLTSALRPLAHGAAGVVVVRRDTPAAVRRNFAVLVDSDSRVRRVIEKPVDPTTDLKGCGVYAFDEAIFDAIARTPRSALRNEYELTDAIQTLIDTGRPVYAADIVRWDVNVTFPVDLLDANLRLLREQELPRLVADSADLGPGVELDDTVVGPGARLYGPARLEQCLVLPGGQVAPRSGPTRRHVFGQQAIWSEETQQPERSGIAT